MVSSDTKYLDWSEISSSIHALMHAIDLRLCIVIVVHLWVLHIKLASLILLIMIPWFLRLVVIPIAMHTLVQHTIIHSKISFTRHHGVVMFLKGLSMALVWFMGQGLVHTISRIAIPAPAVSVFSTSIQAAIPFFSLVSVIKTLSHFSFSHFALS